MQFCPNSNISLVSKILERLVCERINIHLGKIGKLPLVQSGYRRNYSTETALTKVVSDIIMAADTGDVTVLALRDLRAAFDMVDHVILLQRLQTTHRVTGNALQLPRLKLQYYNVMIHRTSWHDSCIAVVSSQRHSYRTLPYIVSHSLRSCDMVSEGYDTSVSDSMRVIIIKL